MWVVEWHGPVSGRQMITRGAMEPRVGLRGVGRWVVASASGWFRLVRASLAPLSLVMALLVVGEARTAAAEAATSVFEGAWFRVAYPADFAVVPSLPSTTNDGFDSAFFESPDGAVEFYVFAPQWGGNPADIALDPDHEDIAAEEIVESGGRKLTWRTIRAKDGSYERAYQITEDPAGPSLSVVGIKYRDTDALGAYRPAYIRFKESLELFAD
jgi:hypothetical protein